MSGRVTLNDVAQRAGVHYTTVSLALRNNPRIPTSTRKKICDIAEEMGYRPDPMLHALINYRFQLHGRRANATVAYLTSGSNRSAWRQTWSDTEYMAGAETAARGLGFRLEHFWLGEAGLSHGRLSDIIHTRGISGLIIGPNRGGLDAPLALDWEKFCAVKIDNLPCSIGLHRVSSDRGGAVRLAIRKAREAGHRRIGIVMTENWDVECDGAWSSGISGEQWAAPDNETIIIHRLKNRTGKTSISEAGCRTFGEWIEQAQPQIIISDGEIRRALFEPREARGAEPLPFIDVALDHRESLEAGVIHNFKHVAEVAMEMLATQMRLSLSGAPKIPTSTLVECTWHAGEVFEKAKRVPELACAI